MYDFKTVFLGIILFVICYSCTNETSETQSVTTYKQELNVSYGSSPDQKFDIYLPANRTTSTKVMILVHGGGWSSGDKSDMNIFKDLILADFPNLAIANINYRLADANNGPYPMQIEDISAVINHLKNRTSEYIISNKIAFIGVSAGGHLSLLWSYVFDNNAQVGMVCSIVGPTNFLDPTYLNNTNPEIQTLLDLYGANPTTAFLEEVSPLYQVTASAPPTILFYGGQDPLIPTTQGTDLKDRLADLGVTHQFTLYPDAGHGWIGADLIDTWIKLKSFMQTHH